MKTVIQNYKAFQNLKEESYKTLMQYGRIYNAPANTQILFERKESSDIYYVMSGIVAVYKLNEKGKRKIIFMFGKDSYINEDLQDGYTSVMSAQTFEDSTLFCIPKEIFYQLIKTDPVFMNYVYESISLKIRRMYRQLKNSEVRLDKKVASKLYKLAKDYGVESEKGIRIQMELSVTYLADILGAQRESVSRALKILVDEDLILYEKKYFLIKDLEGLVSYFKS